MIKQFLSTVFDLLVEIQESRARTLIKDGKVCGWWY